MNFWQKTLNSLRVKIQTQDLSNFIHWPEIIGTMIANVHPFEFEYLKNSTDWDMWKNTLIESKLQPNLFGPYPATSTNNLHHAYSLQLLKEYTNLNFDEYGTIIEFGGGYGNMCRLFRKMNHKDNYYIYDFEELNKIQNYYLSVNDSIHNVFYLNSQNLVSPKMSNDNLFIALWSLTESPREQRDSLMSHLNFFNCEYILIGFADIFDGNENIEWLSTHIIPKLNNDGYETQITEISHMRNNFYLMAKKI